MNAGFAERFGGLGRLYGAGSLEKLAAAHVAVVGLGGVGSWTVEGLARSGVGHLTLIDLDDVCVTNTNRQLPALAGNLGRPKAEALAERVRLINPACSVTVVMEYLTATNADRLLAPRFAVVVDAIDGTTNKADLIGACVRLGQRCVTVGERAENAMRPRCVAAISVRPGAMSCLKWSARSCGATTGLPAGKATSTACGVCGRRNPPPFRGRMARVASSPNRAATSSSTVPAVLARRYG